MQAARELGPKGQVIPQPPQPLTSNWRLTSQPLAGARSQSAKPAAQLKPQPRPPQEAVALAGVGQTAPLARQEETEAALA